MNDSLVVAGSKMSKRPLGLSLLVDWEEYAIEDTRIDLDRGVRQFIRKPFLDKDMIVQKLGVTSPTALDAKRYVEYQLRLKEVQPSVVRSEEMSPEEVEERRNTSLKYGWWKPGPNTVALELIGRGLGNGSQSD